MTAVKAKAWLGLGLLLSVWLLLFWPTLLDMETVWRGSDTYMHCYLVPLIALYLVREQPPLPAGSSVVLWWPLALLPLVSLLWLLSYASDIALGSHLMAILTLQLLLVSWLGRGKAWHLRFPIFYLLFMLPFGEELNLPLQEITADITVYLLQVAGIPVFREGLYLATPVGHFEVAVACSGLRFLIASLAIGCIFAHLYFKTWYRQWLFMAALVVASILANGARAFLLIWLAELSDMRLGFGADHYVYGWLVFVLVLALMFWLGLRFADKPQYHSRKTPVSANKTDNETTTGTDNTRLANPTLTAQPLITLPSGGPALLSVVVLIFVIFAYLSRTLPLSIAPPAPALLPAPAGYHQIQQADWLVSFPHSLRQGSARSPDGISWFSAEFAPRQDRGELVNWNNQLFSPQLWTPVRQQAVTIACGSAMQLQLRSNSGESRTVLYWYQLDGYCGTDPLRIKLHQLQQLFYAHQQSAAIVALSVATDNDEQIRQLRQAADLLTTGTAAQ